MPRTQTATGPRVQTIDRAVLILRCFDAQNPALGVTELANMTGLSSSTVFRLLSSLKQNGLVSQSGSDYKLGPLVLQLAQQRGVAATLLAAAYPVATRLRDLVNETVGVHELLPSGERTVVGQVEGLHELRRVYTELGAPIPLTYGSPGKVILAHLPASKQEEWLTRPIPSVTPQTINNPSDLKKELAIIRGRGWAESNSERTAGIWSVAAPVFDSSETVIGALGISVPSVRMSDARSFRLGKHVKEAAAEVSALLGAYTLEG